MSWLLHYIAHLLEWNGGHVVSATDKEGRIWIAFKCDGCGEISGQHPSAISNRPPKDEEFN